jgi:hypothetical protein
VRAQGRRHKIIKNRKVCKFNGKKLKIQTKYLKDAASLFLQLLFFPAFLFSQTPCMQHKIHLETFSRDCAEIVWLCMVNTFGLETA